MAGKFWVMAVIAVGLLLPGAYAFAGKSLTPSERIRANAERAEENPDLRGRWDPRFYVRSENAVRSDNMAMEIISRLQKEGITEQYPAYLKVKSFRGNVILEGTVRSDEARQKYESSVRSMRDVKSVENRLEVGSVIEELR